MRCSIPIGKRGPVKRLANNPRRRSYTCLYWYLKDIRLLYNMYVHGRCHSCCLVVIVGQRSTPRDGKSRESISCMIWSSIHSAGSPGLGRGTSRAHHARRARAHHARRARAHRGRESTAVFHLTYVNFVEMIPAMYGV